ncbi:MAG: ABC-type transport system involved in cytochrome c biosis, permease component [Ilumatobacteraceae bacterium]|nr:ABC-type transport system involved in cytochrome c biosis, permease component [Ilumatobacteraceae bacterium]
MTSPPTGTGAGFMRLHPDGTASRGSRILGAVVLVSVVVFLFLALVASKPDESLDAQGQLVRIMYLHVPSAIACYTAFFVTAAASAMYLWKKTMGWDALAASSAEIGVIFVVITLLTGSIWGHTTWGTWWEWDPRLTSTALMFVMYLGYLALRRAIIDPVSRAKQSAVLGIIAIVNVPIVHFSVDWWRSLHQTATVASLDPKINGLRLLALFVGMIVALMLYVWLMMHRFRLAYAEAALEAKGLDLALAERRAEALADGGAVPASVEHEGVS